DRDPEAVLMHDDVAGADFVAVDFHLVSMGSVLERTARRQRRAEEKRSVAAAFAPEPGRDQAGSAPAAEAGPLSGRAIGAGSEPAGGRSAADGAARTGLRMTRFWSCAVPSGGGSGQKRARSSPRATTSGETPARSASSC